jgi:hypothetical protein
MDRTTRIAMLARLYLLLGLHPEFMTTKTGELRSRVMDAPIPLNCVDRTLVMGATEIDRMCAGTVMVLREQMSKPILSALGFLDPDRIVAMYYALPNRRRKQVKDDPVWGYHVGHAPPELAEVLRDGCGWLDEHDRYTADRTRIGPLPELVVERLERTKRAVLAQRTAGLALEMCEGDWEFVEQAEQIGKRYIESVAEISAELAKLDDPDDLDAIDAAIARVAARNA